MSQIPPLDNPPKEGNYFTGQDIDHGLNKTESKKPGVPPTSNKPGEKPLSNSQIPRPKESLVPGMRGYIKSRHIGDNNVNANKTKKQIEEEELAKEAELKAAEEQRAWIAKERLAMLPFIVRPFVSGSKQRAYNRPALIWKWQMQQPNNDGFKKKHRNFYVIVCMYQFLVGTLGGIVVGIETDYFNRTRLSTSNVPVKFFERTLHKAVQESSVAIRVAKRALVSGFVFDFIDRHIEEYRGKKDWRNMGMSGIITGGLFGMRGGLRGMGSGAAVFGGFAAMAGIFYQYRRKASKQD